MKKVIALLICFMMLFSGCGFNSGVAILRIESSTKTSWKQSHDYLKGTEKRTLSLGGEPQEMIIEVVTEKGEIDITITGKNGKEIIAIDDAETGTYEFFAEGRIKIKVEADEHKGSFEIKKADS